MRAGEHLSEDRSLAPGPPQVPPPGVFGPMDSPCDRCVVLELLQLVRLGHSRGVDMIGVLLEMLQVRFAFRFDRLRDICFAACHTHRWLYLSSGDADHLRPDHAMARGRSGGGVGPCVLTRGADRPAGLQNLRWYQY